MTVEKGIIVSLIPETIREVEIVGLPHDTVQNKDSLCRVEKSRVQHGKFQVLPRTEVEEK